MGSGGCRWCPTEKTPVPLLFTNPTPVQSCVFRRTKDGQSSYMEYTGRGSMGIWTVSYFVVEGDSRPLNVPSRAPHRPRLDNTLRGGYLKTSQETHTHTPGSPSLTYFPRTGF